MQDSPAWHFPTIAFSAILILWCVRQNGGASRHFADTTKLKLETLYAFAARITQGGVLVFVGRVGAGGGYY